MISVRERLRYIATTINGKEVYVDPEGSHAATHLADTPELLAVVKELLGDLEVTSENLYLERDMLRIIGMCDLVETTADDEIIYAKRLNRTNYTRFVKGRSPQPCSTVTVALRARKNGSYELRSAWIGYAVPQFPGDLYETPESKPFWRNHALAWGNQAIQPGTERSSWPWS